MSEPLFQEIVSKLQRGDTHALKVVFEAYGSYCLHRLRRHVHCSLEDAEDVLQDAVLVFHENALRNKIQYTNNLQNYLYSICFNLYRTRQQQQTRRNDHHRRVADELYETYQKPRIEEELARQEQLATVRLAFAAFDRLGENCRQLLTYFYIDELDNPTIAQKMNLANSNVVKANKFRCMRRWAQHVRTLRANKADAQPQDKTPR